VPDDEVVPPPPDGDHSSPWWQELLERWLEWLRRHGWRH
jgi:hypothetical protein